MADEEGKVVHLRAWKETREFDQVDTRAFFEDLKNNPFLTIVVYDDGHVVIFEKDMDAAKIHAIHKVIGQRIAERKPDGSS